jgi:hypothetical protein
MAIAMVRVRIIGRSKGGSLAHTVAYNERQQVKAERTDRTATWRVGATSLATTTAYNAERAGHLRHGVMLPEGASEKLRDTQALVTLMDSAEKRVDAQLAKEAVIALPADPGITDDDREELVRRFAQQQWVSKGLTVIYDLHRPHDGENEHAHVIISTRRLEGDHFGPKARDLNPPFRTLPHGQHVVSEADGLGEAWRAVQNAYFVERGLQIRVDPLAPIPQKTIGIVRQRAGKPWTAERIEANEIIREANAEIVRDPEKLRAHLERQGAPMAGTVLQRFLARFLRDPEERREVAEKLQETTEKLRETAAVADRTRLEREQWAASVPSGWRELTVKDIAREQSLAFRTAEKAVDRAEKAQQKAQSAVQWGRGKAYEAEQRIRDRQATINPVLRIGLGVLGIADREIAAAEKDRKHGRAIVKKYNAKAGEFGTRKVLATVAANAAFALARPAAERELGRRQEIARTAKAELRRLDQVQGERQDYRRAERRTERRGRGIRI